MRNYRILENRLNNLNFLPIQNVRQYYVHDVAKYEKISPKESADIKVAHNSFQHIPILRF